MVIVITEAMKQLAFRSSSEVSSSSNGAEPPWGSVVVKDPVKHASRSDSYSFKKRDTERLRRTFFTGSFAATEPKKALLRSRMTGPHLSTEMLTVSLPE